MRRIAPFLFLLSSKKVILPLFSCHAIRGCNPKKVTATGRSYSIVRLYQHLFPGGLFTIKALLLSAIFLFYIQASAQMPQVLKDINGSVTLHSQTTSGYNFKGYNGYVYFSAEDGFGNYELWKTNGTETGTVKVKEINPVPLHLIPNHLLR